MLVRASYQITRTLQNWHGLHVKGPWIWNCRALCHKSCNDRQPRCAATKDGIGMPIQGRRCTIPRIFALGGMSGNDVKQMPVQDLAALLSNNDEVANTQFIDVREDWEFTTSALPNFILRPLSQLQSWGSSAADELKVDKRTVVLCHHGIRSQRVSEFLVGQGFDDVYNVSGGIDAYSIEIDQSIPTY